MNPRRLLFASTLLNFALFGAVGYLVCARQTTPLPGSIAAASPTHAATSTASSSSISPTIAAPSLPPAPLQADTRSESVSPQPTEPAALVPPPSVAAAQVAPSQPAVVPDSAPTESDADGSAVESASAGNFLHFQGMRVAVARAYTAQSPANPALGVDITPENATATPNTTAAANSTGAMAAESGAAAIPASSATEDSSAQTARNGRADSGATSAPNPQTVSSNAPADTQHGDGFTREEELFRTKWGWAAFDAAQSAAAREAANQSAAH
jgi:hypothetical protein